MFRCFGRSACGPEMRQFLDLNVVAYDALGPAALYGGPKPTSWFVFGPVSGSRWRTESPVRSAVGSH